MALKTTRRNPVVSRRMAWSMALVIAVMFGFGFAMSPLYDVVCRAIGIGGKPVQVEAEAAVPAIDGNRTVTVEFTGNAMAGLPWEFHALTKKIDVHPGAVTTIAYYARNSSAETVTGQAVPSVTPPASAEFFKKIECFCFTRQKLAPGEAREMPVRFFIDPALPPELHTVTLSYGFFNADKSQAERYGAAAAGSGS